MAHITPQAVTYECDICRRRAGRPHLHAGSGWGTECPGVMRPLGGWPKSKTRLGRLLHRLFGPSIELFGLDDPVRRKWLMFSRNL